MRSTMMVVALGCIGLLLAGCGKTGVRQAEAGCGHFRRSDGGLTRLRKKVNWKPKRRPWASMRLPV